MSNNSVPCNNCSGKGFKINQFNGNEENCRVCFGEGEIIPCDSFNSDKSPAFRNRKCNGCHATENQHKITVSA